MSKLILTVCCVVLFSLPGVALHSRRPPPPQPSVAASGGEADGTAFTGGELTTPVLLAGVLVIVGGAAVYVARRRAQRFSGWTATRGGASLYDPGRGKYRRKR